MVQVFPKNRKDAEKYQVCNKSGIDWLRAIIAFICTKKNVSDKGKGYCYT